MNKNQKISNLEDLIEREFGQNSSPDREAYERAYESFKLGVMIRQARKDAKMTQK